MDRLCGWRGVHTVTGWDARCNRWCDWCTKLPSTSSGTRCSVRGAPLRETKDPHYECRLHMATRGGQPCQLAVRPAVDSKRTVPVGLRPGYAPHAAPRRAAAQPVTFRPPFISSRIVKRTNGVYSSATAPKTTHLPACSPRASNIVNGDRQPRGRFPSRASSRCPPSPPPRGNARPFSAKAN